MIIPMKKYSFLIYHQIYYEFLSQLQNLGVVHIIEKSVEAGENIKKLKQEIGLLGKALKFLRSRKQEIKKVETDKDGKQILEGLHDNQAEYERLTQQLNSIRKEIKNLTPWGHFSINSIGKLTKQGVTLRLFVVSEKGFRPEWSMDYYIETINKIGTTIYFALFQKGIENISIEAEEVKLPDRSLKEVENLEKEIFTRLDRLDEDFDRIAAQFYHVLERVKMGLQEKLDFNTAIISTEVKADNKLMILHGWTPEDKEEKLKKFLAERNILYLYKTPDLSEKVPICLKNNRFSRAFEPIGKMFSLPSYHEIDLTPFFAPFFALFFGLCLGDAGYGLLILIASIFLRHKVNCELKPILILGQILGVATTVIGILTGTIFGVALVEIPALKDKIILSEPNDLFALSLYIGIIQIIFGMCIQAANRYKQFGIKYAISTIGTILLVVSVIDLYHFKFITEVSTLTATAGLILILFYNDPEINPYIRPLKGLYVLYNVASGFLGDFLSYVRLFALGISSAILGLVINQIGSQLLGIPFVGPVLFVIFLVLGHTGNLCLAGLGAFVHPMRLTFVEFYKNAGFAGGGKPYKPFAHKI